VNSRLPLLTNRAAEIRPFAASRGFATAAPHLAHVRSWDHCWQCWVRQLWRPAGRHCHRLPFANKDLVRFRLSFKRFRVIHVMSYVPGEFAWRGVEASGYMFIHCVWVYSRQHQRKGWGSVMVQACLDEATNLLSVVPPCLSQNRTAIAEEIHDLLKRTFSPSIAMISPPTSILLISVALKPRVSPGLASLHPLPGIAAPPATSRIPPRRWSCCRNPCLNP
jgi:hypothetical protein